MSSGDLGYGGDVSAIDAFAILRAEPDAVLVDVRTRAEWSYVGLPDLAGIAAGPVLLEWQVFPTMAANDAFVSTLSAELTRRGTPVEAPLLFLCRSGARSLAAARAMTAVGFTRCLNIAGGFEGPLDAARHRGVREGWKAQGLPWVQS